jgi:hypothetical protein
MQAAAFYNDKWHCIDQRGEDLDSFNWNRGTFVDLTEDAIYKVLSERWPKEDAIIKVVNHFRGADATYTFLPITYDGTIEGGKEVPESGTVDGDFVYFWTPEEAAERIYDICKEGMDKIYGKIKAHEEDVSAKTAKGDALKARMKDYKPVRRGTLQDRVNDKLKSLSVEELAKLLGV